VEPTPAPLQAALTVPLPGLGSQLAQRQLGPEVIDQPDVIPRTTMRPCLASLPFRSQRGAAIAFVPHEIPAFPGVCGVFFTHWSCGSTPERASSDCEIPVQDSLFADAPCVIRTHDRLLRRQPKKAVKALLYREFCQT